MEQHPSWGSWHDDRQWASSRIVKNGNKWFDQEQSTVITWCLEVRSERFADCDHRLGEMFITKNTVTGDITMSIEEQTFS